VILGIGKKTLMPDVADTLPDRDQRMPVAATHAVLGNPLQGPWPEHMETAVFGMGCFWGVERLFWQQSGVWSTAVGYTGGYTANASYQDVCSGRTGHNEVCLVVYDPSIITYTDLLKVFWESHDPTQGMRQGPDCGTQYRSGIYTLSARQQQLAETTRDRFQKGLSDASYGRITTEIFRAPAFYYAEDEHQQYLHKHPSGYCSLRGTGVVCAMPKLSSISVST